MQWNFLCTVSVLWALTTYLPFIVIYQNIYSNAGNSGKIGLFFNQSLIFRIQKAILFLNNFAIIFYLKLCWKLS